MPPPLFAGVPPGGARRIRKAAKPPTAAQRVRWGEFPGEAPPVADKASRKKGAARLAGHFGPGIAMPRREQGPSGGNELSGLPESERSVAWADDAAPRAARIAVTPQALRAAALYRLRPPGRHRCHAPEIPRRLWRSPVGRDDPVCLPGPLSLPCSVGRGLAPAACPPGISWGYTPILLDHSPSFGGVFF